MKNQLLVPTIRITRARSELSIFITKQSTCDFFGYAIDSNEEISLIQMKLCKHKRIKIIQLSNMFENEKTIQTVQIAKFFFSGIAWDTTKIEGVEYKYEKFVGSCTYTAVSPDTICPFEVI